MTSNTIETPATMENITTEVRENDNKFLAFTLGDEVFGVEILKIREIIGVIDITPLPQMPVFVKGVINLRGKIIPVIEMRTKFGLESVPYTEETCIIVVEVEEKSTGDQFQMGVIVDTVREVRDVPASQIEPAPAFGCAVSTEYILGMGKVSDGVIILLDIDGVLSRGELTKLNQVAQTDTTVSQSVGSE